MGVVSFEAELNLGKTYIFKQTESVGTWIVEGYASTSDLDAQKHIVTPEAIKMGAESLMKYDTVLFNHDPNKPIGKIQKAEATDGGLLIKVAISKTEPKIWEQVKDGTLSKFSIRGLITDSEVQKDQRTGEEILMIKGMDLHETSLVSVPANPRARSLSWYIEKALKEDNSEDIEKKKHYRLPGESLQDCVSRKTELNVKHGMPQKQAVAAAYSMCGDAGKDMSEKDMEKKAYPWDQCIRDQKAKGYSDARANKICAAIKNRTVSHMVDEWGLASTEDEAINFIAQKMENDKLYEYAWEKFLEIQKEDCGCDKQVVKKDKKNFEQALNSLQAGLDSLQGEDKDQVQAIIRSINALIGRVYSKSDKGGQDIVAEKEEVKKEAAAEEKTEEVKKEASDEKKEEEVKKEVVEQKFSLDVSALKDVIEQLQGMVKQVNSQSEAVKATMDEVGKAKSEIEKMLTELNAVIKEIPIRKGQAAKEESPEDREEKEENLLETEEFKKEKNPFNQLTMLINKQLKGVN